MAQLKLGRGKVAHAGSLPLNIAKDIVKNKYLYIMLSPVLAYFIIFQYFPMYGAIIAFKDFNPRLGIGGSAWAGLEHFKDFFGGMYFWRVFKNTLMISFYDLVFGFPAPLILALLLNEVKNALFKRSVQTITYLPHFISLVIIAGMIKDFTSSDGVINDIIAFFGGERVTMLLEPSYFRTIFVSSNIWQHVGWGTIIYLAALSAIDQEQYEACKIDGGGRWKQMLHVTLPGLLPVFVILLILDIGRIMSVGFEKVILLYNPTTYVTADVISSYVYRIGLQDFQFSFSSAVGLFNSVINFALVIGSNWISRKLNNTGLW
ncbi:sugar ABC transporter permease [Paenibacillus sp. MY03]|jgi:putative aldouronate transport system permease protein|uniref:Sugar ABC transporter permease n=1 Tax=Paenibacillus agaridevorans TaxID=171404 RepID=A0A2R5EXH2_9BACL|nr:MULTISPECIES: ABC transporter permease subunit [Paenibacillus]OUS73951.1 sugar ABC transporter permease [Paenibacillus sp. MY03]QNK59592.1 sugar ABC transporter permease [Paenibacillus sp. PAMC21692]GBG11247.1 sugar ABC transporter permease [Paenibacillus agaridevorans]